MKFTALLTTPFLAALALGCSHIPVDFHTETHIQHADGTVEHKSSDWHGTLDQLPEQLGKAGAELGDVTSRMAKELTDVPPPGKVELKDLSPALAKYQGKHGADFLVTARDKTGKPITFQYVRLGVPQYDEFFKTAQEIYALVYETTQLVGQMTNLSSTLLSTNVDANAELRGAVDKALASGGDTELVADLRTMQEMGEVLATLVPQIADKLAKLVQTGEALIASAATSITNPKVVAHLDLVKEGLVSSVNVIKESGSVLVDFSKTLSGFAS
jgi:hypothetical protein